MDTKKGDEKLVERETACEKMSLPSPSTPGSDDAEKLAGARKGLLSLFSGAKTDEEVGGCTATSRL